MSSQNAYDTWHLQKNRAGAIEEALDPWHFTALKLLQRLDGKDVLEIGCGRGDFAILISKNNPGANITAIDFSDAAIEIAKKKLPSASSNIRFEVGDATNLRFSNSSFDYVISCECLEHIPEPQKMAAEIRRVLRNNGRFLVTTENYFNGMLLAWAKCYLTGASFNSGSGIQPHENFFLYWRVRRLLERAGLHVEHMESNHFQWLLLPRVSPPKLCTKSFSNPLWNRVFRPFGRHFTYVGARGR